MIGIMIKILAFKEHWRWKTVLTKTGHRISGASEADYAIVNIDDIHKDVR